MNFNKVGEWLKQNAVGGAALIGSLLSGNVPGALAAGASMVQQATGKTGAADVLKALQTDPAKMVELEKIASEERVAVRGFLRDIHIAELEADAAEHEQTQKTVRSGDNATDRLIRLTRPEMAKQSWWATIFYCFVAVIGELVLRHAGQPGLGLSFHAAMLGFLSSPALAYMGLRTIDKRGKVEKWMKTN